MQQTLRRFGSHFFNSAKTALLGPQILAFAPAIMLGGYWYGGEGLLLFLAIFLPVLFALVGLFTPMRPAEKAIGAVDPITGLLLPDAVVAALDRAFSEEAESGLRTACVVLEVDEFAAFSQKFGTDVTDRILHTLAERIGGVMRGGDVVSRLEGSVFAIALAPARRCDLETLIQIAARLQTAIAEPMLVGELRIYVTASVGFCSPRRANEKIGTACLEAAEAALAEAQACGTASIRAASSQARRKRVTRTGLVGEVSEALDSGQIKPWFQPQISTDTGDVTGVEALARWEHPERGVILPGAFLPAVSAASMGDRLSEVMLFRSLLAMQDWDKAGLMVPSVGVNFEMEDLANPKLCERIQWELDRFELSPERLTIEILETVIAGASNETVARNVGLLADLGCRVDLDDFGTGHASIANLKRFSVDRIKIDRSFVTRVDQDRQQQQMIMAILEMADRLGVDTLGEGVEAKGEHAMLAQLGCRHVQGFCIAKPMPFDDMTNWLNARGNAVSVTAGVSREKRA